MTQEFSQILVQQVKEKKLDHNLRVNSPIFEFLHPKLIEAELNFLNNPEQEIGIPQVLDWFVYPFRIAEEAKSSLPSQCIHVAGHPFQIHRILTQNCSLALIEFDSLGVVILSKTELHLKLQTGIHQCLIPIWLNYAMSTELWGPQGKWTRFHQRLHDLFEKYKLLKDQSLPGFYPLDLRAQKLEKFGFHGTTDKDTYTLTLPWTFPLSALVQLENVISQEF
jgi:hypothetical protein